MRIKEIHLPIESIQTLKRVQQQARVVERARKQLMIKQEENPLIKSPRMDGTPRGSRFFTGLENRYIRLEEYQQRVEREENRLDQACEEARKVIYTLPDKVQDFCFWHYIEGISVQEAAAYIDRDISTCWRYKRAIERIHV